MAYIDILIAAAVAVSIVVGVFRGFVKEAISIVSLLLAIWAAQFFGPEFGGLSDGWFSSAEVQTWFGRILVFFVILSAGGLLGWGVSKLVRLSILSGMDRLLGAMFGLGRALLLTGVFILGGRFAGFDNDAWWTDSIIIAQLEFLADWIQEMAPEGLDMLTPDAPANGIPVKMPDGVGL
ncbi:MAG: CvpA family protein [Pseudomonadota bacterium]